MLASNEIFLIVTNVFDGLFSGGLMVILSELSAELAYPVGESISLGFIYACESLIRFIIKFTVDILTFTTIYEPEEKERMRNQNDLIWVYFVLMGIFLVFTVISIFLLMKAPFVLRRSLADACLEVPYDEDEGEWRKQTATTTFTTGGMTKGELKEKLMKNPSYKLKY